MVNEIETPGSTAALAAVVNMLSPKDAEFAHSLMNQFKAKGTLSEKQWYWVETLAKRAKTPNAGKSFAPGAWAAFARVTPEKAAKPALILAMGEGGDGGALRVVRRHPFSSYLTLQWRASMTSFGGWLYVGMLRSNDEVKLSGMSGFDKGQALAALEILGVDTTSILKATGLAFGVCANCGRTLTDPASIAFGIGPVCAGYLGLGGEYAATKALVAAGALA